MRISIVMLLALALCAGTARAAHLRWTGGQSQEWNTTHTNWTDGLAPAVFQNGDSVTFAASGGLVFIGLNGVPGSVSADQIMLNVPMTFSGGNIATGGITYDSGSLVFTNYTESLTFAGGLAMRRSASALLFEVRNAANQARLQLGRGPIVFSSSSAFAVLVGHGKGVELATDLLLEAQCRLTIEPFSQQTNGTVRFLGNVFLNGAVLIDNAGPNFGRNPGTPGPFPDALAGTVVLWQQNRRFVRLNLNGWYGHRPFEISGSIIDGTGSASNRLEFSNYGMYAFRITGTNNTYRHGTDIGPSPSAPAAAIEVAPESSLGTGDVLVEGPLRLRGNRNIHGNATVRIANGGRVELDEEVIIRLKALQLGGNLHTSGTFSSNNAPGFIVGGGEFRLPSSNQPPIIAAVQSPSSVYAGNDVTFEAVANDPDGRVTKVEFAFWENTLILTATNAPWRVTLTNVADRIRFVRVTAFDDEGASTIRLGQDVHVLQPPAPQLRNARLMEPNALAFDFEAIATVKYSLETHSDLSNGEWQRLHLLPGGSGTITLTNPIPADSSAGYFRIRAGHQ